MILLPAKRKRREKDEETTRDNSNKIEAERQFNAVPAHKALTQFLSQFNFY